VVAVSVTGGATVVGDSVGAVVAAVVAVVGGSVVDVVVVVAAVVDVVALLVVGAAVDGGADVAAVSATVVAVVPRLRSPPFESLEHDTTSSAAPKPRHSDLHRVHEPPLSVDFTLTMY